MSVQTITPADDTTPWETYSDTGMPVGTKEHSVVRGIGSLTKPQRAQKSLMASFKWWDATLTFRGSRSTLQYAVWTYSEADAYSLACTHLFRGEPGQITVNPTATI